MDAAGNGQEFATRTIVVDKPHGGTPPDGHRTPSGPWGTRFRLARAIMWIFWLTIFAIVLGKVLHTTPVLAMFQLPHILWVALPLIIQIILLMALMGSEWGYRRAKGLA